VVGDGGGGDEEEMMMMIWVRFTQKGENCAKGLRIKGNNLILPMWLLQATATCWIEVKSSPSLRVGRVVSIDKTKQVWS